MTKITCTKIACFQLKNAKYAKIAVYLITSTMFALINKIRHFDLKKKAIDINTEHCYNTIKRDRFELSKLK